MDNLERFNVFLSNFPAGSGYDNLVYYAQMVENEPFKRFNYGERDNLAKYGSYEPPLVPI